MLTPPTSRRGLAAAFLSLALATAGCRGCGDRARPPAAGSAHPISSTPAELATLDLPELAGWPGPGEEAQVEGYVNEAGTGGAIVIQTAKGARLVFGRSVSPVHPSIHLVTVSPDGKRVAFVAPGPDGKVRVTADGKAGPPFDSAEDLAFTRTGKLTYRAALGDRQQVVIEQVAGSPQAFVGDLKAAADGSTLVVPERAAPTAPFAIAAYDWELRRKVLREIASDEVVIDATATRAAAVLADGGRKRVAVYDLAGGAAPRQGAAYDEIEGLGFDPSGAHVYYSARQDGKLLFALDDKAEAVPAPGLYETPVVNLARGTVAVVLGNVPPSLHLVFERQAPPAKGYDGITEMTFSPDGSRCAYVAVAGERSFVVVNGAEGPPFDRVVTPRFSPDGAYLAYRARLGGKRFAVVADADGKILRQLADHEQVFPVRFTPDSGAVAYAVKDGPSLRWMVEKVKP